MAWHRTDGMPNHSWLNLLMHVYVTRWGEVIHKIYKGLVRQIPNQWWFVVNWSCRLTAIVSTLLFKSNGIYFTNAFLIYRSLIFWNKLLSWHLSSFFWGWCEISYAYDYSSRLYDHSKSVRFEKRDIKTLATGTVFGGYFIIRDRLLWELKLFLFHWIEMKLVHKITVCVSDLEIKLTLS